MKAHQLASPFAGGLALVAALAHGCTPELGELPARCDASADESSCPEGFACIEGVCARPGTSIPITLASLQYLRGVDLRLIPLGDGALAVWQVYRYDDEQHDFVAARLGTSGEVSEPFVLVRGYPANSNYLEPYFDVYSPSASKLQLSIGAAPFDDAPESRLTHFDVALPAVGSESFGATSTQRWELRVRTIGYGAVSRPRFASRTGSLELGYFESLVSDLETLGELAVFQLDTEGNRVAPPACASSECCQANLCVPARAGSTVAVGVVDAFTTESYTYWIVDDVRPSFVRQPVDPEGVVATGELPRLAVPVLAGNSALFYVQPSPRAGDGLSTDEVDGPAILFRLPVSAEGVVGAAQRIGELPAMRDTPRPVWIPRGDGPGLLITPGPELGSPTISVYALDTSSGSFSEVASIPRYSSVPIAALQATVASGRLFVSWLDEQPDRATLRATVIDAP